MVQIILGLNFIFLLFFGMVMCDNEFETMENKIQARDKIEPQQLHAEGLGLLGKTINAINF